MKRAVIYARVAQKNDTTGELEKQVKELQAYCKGKDYDVFETIAESRAGRYISRDLLMVVADFKNLDVIVAKDKVCICRNHPELLRFEELAEALEIEIDYMSE